MQEESGVRLRKLLKQIGAKPDPSLMRRAESVLAQWISPGHRVEGTCGDGKPAIAIFDPVETTSALHGMYIEYVFDPGLRTVTLTLTQGAGEIADHVGSDTARKVLWREAAAIRRALRPRDIADLSDDCRDVDIASRTYRLDRLSRESKLVADLRHFLHLYAEALKARASLEPQGLAPSRAQEPAIEPEPEVPRERKVLIRAVTRRTALATVVAASMAYVVPATALRDRGFALPPPIPDETKPVFTIDVSQHDWERRGGNLDWVGIRRSGIAGMCARATYGDPAGYNWPTYRFGDFALAAMEAGMGLRGGYHNIVRGDQASINRQVDWLRQELDKHNANWAMLDVERYDELVGANMWASWDDVRRFDDRWAAVDSRVLVGYIPPWNWSKFLGQPDLREFRGPVIASNYPLEQANDHFRQLYDRVGGDNGDGWAAYGSRVPEGWQYSARAMVPGGPDICDVNAWRMSSGRLKNLLGTRA